MFKGLIRFKFTLQMAANGIFANPLRSILTILGVTIGVASVVSLMGIGEGARLAVKEQFESLGANVIVLDSTDEKYDFKPSLADDISTRVKNITMSSPVLNGETDFKWRRLRGEAEVIGVNENFTAIRDHSMATGQFFNQLQVEEYSKVVVLGYTLASQIKAGRSPIGDTIVIKGLEYKIIGVLAAKGENKGENIDMCIVMPYTTAQKVLSKRTCSQIICKTNSSQDAELATVQLSRVFRKQLGQATDLPVSNGGGGMSSEQGGMDEGGMDGGMAAEPMPMPDDGASGGGTIGSGNKQEQQMTITSLNQMIKEADKANRILSLLLGGIAAVSLLVGGLGIMNIMLVAVSERTGEIGVRRALGARQGDLLVQFIAEALYLSGIGAIIGVIVGILGVDLFGRYGFETIISYTAIEVAVFVALGCGLIFGVYPAVIASSVPPVEALRKGT